MKLIDDLLGRDNLKFGDGPEQVKAEAMRQLEIEFRAEVDERATFYVGLGKLMKGQQP